MSQLYALTERTAQRVRQLVQDGGTIAPGDRTGGVTARGLTWVKVTGSPDGSGWHPGVVSIDNAGTWSDLTAAVKVIAADATAIVTGKRYPCTRTGDATDGTAQFRTEGFVLGPSSATAQQIAVFDGTTGKLIQFVAATCSDLGAISAYSLNTSPGGVVVQGDGTHPGTASLMPSNAGAVRFAAPAGLGTHYLPQTPVTAPDGSTESFVMLSATGATEDGFVTVQDNPVTDSSTRLSVGADLWLVPRRGGTDPSYLAGRVVALGRYAVYDPNTVTIHTGDSGTDTWGSVYVGGVCTSLASVTIGSGLSLSGGVLSCTVSAGGSGTVTSVDITPPAAGITASGGPITTSGSITLALANDLAALEGLTGTNTIYYRSAADTWSPVTVGSGLSFSGGTLSCTVTGSSGTVTSVGLSMPSGFTVTGSPVTGAGTLTVATALSGILKGDGSGFGVVTVGTGLSYSGGTLSATGVTLDGKVGTVGADHAITSAAGTWEDAGASVTLSAGSWLVGFAVTGQQTPTGGVSFWVSAKLTDGSGDVAGTERMLTYSEVTGHTAVGNGGSVAKVTPTGTTTYFLKCKRDGTGTPTWSDARVTGSTTGTATVWAVKIG